MKYFIDLFSPETAEAFSNSDRTISGFRISRKTYIENQGIGPGDKFICYCTRIQRFIGVLEIVSGLFIDRSPIFLESEDPYSLRFKVKPLVWLPLEKGIPIHAEIMWNNLSFTKNLSHKSRKWTHMVFASPKLWPSDDCEYIENKLLEQADSPREYPFSEDDKKKLKTTRIILSGEKQVPVSVPDNEEEIEEESTVLPAANKPRRESIEIQAKLSEIGEKLGFKIWLPKPDRARVLEIWKPESDSLLDDLPLVFDETTLKTIRNIDILWIKRRSIVRAFEVEDTTSIYSGILRMADLLSLQPMLDIKIHIVAPDSRREAVFQQISRPVFAVMEKGPLAEICSYISYSSVNELSKENRLEYMTDSILDEYSELADN